MNALFLSEIITPVIRCEESFRNESFVNVTEDPEIEAVKNIEINLNEFVWPHILDFYYVFDVLRIENQI